MACFKVATKFRSLYFMILVEQFASLLTSLYSAVNFESSCSTMESLPLKVLDLDSRGQQDLVQE